MSSPSSDHPTSAQPSTQPPRPAHEGPTGLGKWLVITLVIAVIGLAFGLLPRWKQAAQVRADTQSLSVLSVLTTHASLQKGTIQSALPCEIRPWIEAPIHARANGYLHRWLVDLGSQVESGQLLAEIDTPEIKQELDQARAQLAQAEAARELSATTAARWKELLKTESVSEQDAAEKTADLALKIALGDSAKANVHRFEDMLSFGRVTAPFAGVITARRVDVGDLISSTSGKELFRLAQVSTLRVFVHIPQPLARDISPGKVAELTVPERPHEPRTVKVVRHAGMIEAASRTLLVELELENKRGDILAGSFGVLRFPDFADAEVLAIPSNTLLFRSEGVQVGVVDPASGTVKIHPIQMGRDFGPTVEVLDGITLQDLLVLNPPDSLVDGMKVQVIKNSTRPGSNAPAH